MPWDPTMYEDFVFTEVRFENPRSLDVAVDPAANRGANVLSIYTGTVIMGTMRNSRDIFEEFQPSSSGWSRGVGFSRRRSPDRSQTSGQ